MNTRVLLCDDHVLVRSGFRLILQTQADITVVGEAADGAEAVALAARENPDVVVMDIGLPDMDGIEATRRLVAQPGGGPAVLILTAFAADRYVYEALRAGACGFLLKDTSPERLIEGVRTVARGDALLAPTALRQLVGRHAAGLGSTADPRGVAALTDRELAVLRLVARGLDNGDIAARLGIGEGTVKTHTSRILTKLGLRSRVQAVVLAYETGLVPLGTAPPPR